MVHSDGNILSVLVFFLWIPIAIWGAHRWPPAKAASLLLLLPLMFLPERVQFDLPGFPTFAKRQIAIVWLLIGVLLFHRHRLKTVPLSRWIKFSILVLLGGSVLTVLLNTDPVFEGSVYLEGHGPYDAVNAVIINTVNYVLPFVLAAAMFHDAADLRVLFRTLVGATLVYGVFQLIELRLSPQLNYWVYGFYQHDFQQMVRGDSYRPMVFMSHALTVAMFTMMGLLAAAAVHKANMRIRGVPAAWAVAFLWVLALLNKGLAALLYTLVAVPLILFSQPKTQFRLAIFLCIMALTYPALRSANLIPVESLREVAAARFGEEREASLMVRFDNEQDLLTRARERPVFGWGTYCRSCIHDPWTGKQLSIADGDWIITIGVFGVVGFLGKYLLLLLPVFLVARRIKYVPRESDRRLLAALALMVGFSAFDLLPNTSSHYLPYVFSGALLGCATGISREVAWHKRRKQLQGLVSAQDRSAQRESPGREDRDQVPIRRSFLVGESGDAIHAC